MTTDIQACEGKVRGIVNGSDADVADAIVTLDGLAARIKELQADAKAAMLERIREHGPFRMGGWEYTLTRPKKEKDRDVTVSADRLLTIVGGDFKKFIGCLASDALKPGAVKKELAECGAPPGTFEELFEVTWGDKLEVTKVNLAFQK